MHRNQKTAYDVFIYKYSTDRFIKKVKPLKAETGRAGS